MSRIVEAWMPDLFGYPLSPGYKEPTTSRDAACTIAPSTPLLRERVFAAIRDAGADGLTPDECALKLGIDEKAIRPRFTELGPRHAGRIIPTGERRRNESKLKAKVWKVK